MSETSPPFFLSLYKAVSSLSTPLLKKHLQSRLAKGKENPERILERQGQSKRMRSSGPVIWIHCASVGEAKAVIPLLEKLLKQHKDHHILLTTGTVTSAALMEKALPSRAVHQFVPVDHPKWVASFLDHWKPDLALWVESELWPNLILQTAQRHIPMALLNARLSSTSYGRWKKLTKSAHHLLNCFELCLAQDDETATRLRNLGASNVSATGNFKFAASPLPFDAKALETLRQQIKERFCWLSASTHNGEEAQLIDAHQKLKEQIPDLLSIIVPRHPERGDSIRELVSTAGLSAHQRSKSELISKETEFYIADTLGELGLFYRLCPISFIGGSLIPHGGQNPLEPARLESAILHGPHVHNFKTIYHDLDSEGASIQIEDTTDLAHKVLELRDANKRKRQTEKATTYAASADHVIDKALEKLAPLIKKSIKKA